MQRVLSSSGLEAPEEKSKSLLPRIQTIAPASHPNDLTKPTKRPHLLYDLPMPPGFQPPESKEVTPALALEPKTEPTRTSPFKTVESKNDQKSNSKSNNNNTPLQVETIPIEDKGQAIPVVLSSSRNG